MTDKAILDRIFSNWVHLRLDTADDQYLAINKSNGALDSFRTTAPADEGWYRFLIIPKERDGNKFWIFNHDAQNGSGEVVTDVSGLGLHQWKFEDLPEQVFELRTRALPKDGSPKITLIMVRDGKAVSTRWNGRAFLWDYIPDDNQQILHLEEGARLPVPMLPVIEGEPGHLDRDKLQVTGFDDKVVNQTDWRVVGVQLIPFVNVSDTWTLGEQMRSSPYYIMTRSCAWRLGVDWEYSGAGQTERKLEYEIGTHVTEGSSIEEHLNTEIGARAEWQIGQSTTPGKAGGISFSHEWGTTWKRTSQIERYETRKGSITVTFKEGKRTRVASWNLVNRYTLRRQTGDIVGDFQFIEDDAPARIERSYPPEGATFAGR